MASLAVMLGCLALGAISALETRHMSVTHGFPLDWLTVLIAATPRWIGLAIMMPPVLWVAARTPLTPLRGARIALHLAIFLAVTIAQAALDTWATGWVAPEIRVAFGLVPRLIRSWYNVLPTVVTTYAAVLLAVWGMGEARERERRTVRASQLEALLQAARLSALRARLQPHFLYNTLNAIAALVAGVEPARAVAAIEQLSELLHASLRDDGREEVRVEEEMLLVERYLALQRMRFGDRVRHESHVAPDAADCLVPVLLLQPIVENAVVHGLDAGQERVNIRIDVVATRSGIELTVENDGTWLPSDGSRRDGRGIGLAATRARLTTLHGERASLTLAPRRGGGASVRVVLPRIVDPHAGAGAPAALHEATA